MKTNNDFLVAWMRLAFTPKVGPRTFGKLLERFNSPQAVLANTDEVKRLYNLHLAPPSQPEIEDAIAKCYAFGAQILLPSHDDYPQLLKQTTGYPPVLFVRGNAKLLNMKTLSVVGTRNSSLNGEKIARKIVKELSGTGLVIASGLARGIDSIVHQEALATGTIGVVAGGINCIYPKENAKLQNTLYEKGLVITENMFDVLPTAQNFPRRNRIISGIAAGVLIIEATQKSGTMITANYALEQGRDVFAVPGSPLDPRAYGTNFLIKNGAILVRDAKDVMAELALPPLADSLGEEQKSHDDANEQQPLGAKVLLKLSTLPIDSDELFYSLQISAGEFNQILTELEILGKIKREGRKVSLIND